MLYFLYYLLQTKSDKFLDNTSFCYLRIFFILLFLLVGGIKLYMKKPLIKGFFVFLFSFVYGPPSVGYQLDSDGIGLCGVVLFD